MTLFFDINKLDKEASGSIIKFIAILKDHYTKSIKKYSYINKYKSIHGNSYLLNPAPLFTAKIDKAYIIQYVKLAARRDYTLFKLFNIISLDLSYFPEINLEIIKHNPLLKIINNQIQFKFEEIKNGTSIWTDSR